MIQSAEWYRSTNGQRAVLLQSDKVLAIATHVGGRQWRWIVPGILGAEGHANRRSWAMRKAREALEEADERTWVAE